MTNLESILKSRHYFVNKGPSSQGYGFSSSHVWMWKLNYKESWVQKNWCFWTVVLEKTLESPLDCKEIQPVHPIGNQSRIHWKDWCWSWSSNTLATWCEELTHWKRPWWWERLKAGREGDDRGWDGWMASPTQWTWLWVSPGSWWWTGRPGVLQSMKLQRVGHDWGTELNWRERIRAPIFFSTLIFLKAYEQSPSFLSLCGILEETSTYVIFIDTFPVHSSLVDDAKGSAGVSPESLVGNSLISTPSVLSCPACQVWPPLTVFLLLAQFSLLCLVLYDLGI